MSVGVPSAWLDEEMTSIQRFIYTRLSELPHSGEASRFRTLVDLLDQHGVHPAEHPDCPRPVHPHCYECGGWRWPCLTIALIAELWSDHPDYQRWPAGSGDLSGRAITPKEPGRR